MKTQAEWNSLRVRCGAAYPCPVCGKKDWCCDFPSLGKTCCMRIKSDKPAHNGGWWHQIKDMPKKVEYHKQIKPQRPVNLKRTWESWSSMTDDDDIKTCALRLGVSSESLSDLGMAWAWQYGAWAFPMRDGAGGVVGIRLRGETGKKWAVAGSRQGVFMPTAWPESTQVALICEGPTDTAAALSIGFK
ncbi:MAG: hypothetical protein PHI33_09215, partial [Smithellaceae bacterium]|nr:hypothetical protein [Smithellaceae bacterium]